MKTKTAVIGAALLSAAAASPAFAQARTTPGGQYSLLGGTTVPSGTNVVSGEFGWPSATFGFTHGLSGNTDVGFKFDLIFGFEDTTTSQFGIGFRVPLRLMLYRRDRISVLTHRGPGLKIFYTTPADFGFQLPVGLAVGLSPPPGPRRAFGRELPLTLVFAPAPGPPLL